MSGEVGMPATLAGRAGVCTMAAWAIVAMIGGSDGLRALEADRQAEADRTRQALGRRLRRDIAEPGGVLMLFVGGGVHGDVLSVPVSALVSGYTTCTPQPATLSFGAGPPRVRDISPTWHHYLPRRVDLHGEYGYPRQLLVLAARDATAIQLDDAVRWALADGIALIEADA